VKRTTTAPQKRPARPAPPQHKTTDHYRQSLMALHYRAKPPLIIGVLDGTFMDVAPTWEWALRQLGGDRVVGFLVVGFRVLVR
jgi:hypothetical protein